MGNVVSARSSFSVKLLPVKYLLKHFKCQCTSYSIRRMFLPNLDRKFITKSNISQAESRCHNTRTQNPIITWNQSLHKITHLRHFACPKTLSGCHTVSSWCFDVGFWMFFWAGPHVSLFLGYNAARHCSTSVICNSQTLTELCNLHNINTAFCDQRYVSLHCKCCRHCHMGN